MALKRVLVAPSLLAACALAFSASGCQETDPKKPATWVAQLDKKDPKKVADALRELRKLKAKETVASIVPLLKHEDGSVREEAAYALEELGDASAVQPLVDAIDLGSSAKGADRANSKIAEALGALGDKKATPALLKMASAKEPLVRLAAVKALGQLKDPASVAQLVKTVEDEATPPLITKQAIIALGDMKAQEAVPALSKAMVLERQGVSFFVEASYALFQIGQPSAVALSNIVSGSDKAYLTWAEDKSRKPAGYLSKGAIVLADLGDKSAVPSLVKLMKWEDPDGEDAFQMIVRGTAAEALGRLRAKEGAAVIAAQVNIAEANIREKFAVALAHIGDRSVLPKLEAAAKDPKSSWTARQSAITGLALLGDGKNKGVIEAAQKQETADAAVKHCLAEESGPTESEPMKQARCQKEGTLRPKFLADELARLLSGDACKQDAACWTGKLKDQNAKVRERAAYELGKLGAPAAVDPLVASCKDDDLYVRRASYIALDWLTQVPEAKSALKAKGDQLAAQLEEEKGKAHTVVVNEDLKRVVWKIKQL